MADENDIVIEEVGVWIAPPGTPFPGVGDRWYKIGEDEPPKTKSHLLSLRSFLLGMSAMAMLVILRKR